MASKTDEIREALEKSKGTGSKLAYAFVVEGLKVLDDYAECKAEYEKALKIPDDDGYRQFMFNGVRAGEQQIHLIASILRSAGRIA